MYLFFFREPLQFVVGAPCWKFARRAELHNALTDVVLQNLGMPVLFQFASTLKGEPFTITMVFVSESRGLV